MTVLNAIRESLKDKRSLLVNNLITILLVAATIGCLPSDIIITRDRPFNISQIHSIAFLPFSGNATGCARKAKKAMESTLIDFFEARKIKVVLVSREWINAKPELAAVIGTSQENRASVIAKIFEVDYFLSGSISECQYFNPNIGDGLVSLTINIYHAETGDLLTKIEGKKIAKSYDSGTINQMTGEIVNAMFRSSGSLNRIATQ